MGVDLDGGEGVVEGEIVVLTEEDLGWSGKRDGEGVEGGAGR